MAELEAQLQERIDALEAALLEVRVRLAERNPDYAHKDRCIAIIEAALAGDGRKPKPAVDPQMLQRVKDFVAADMARIKRGRR